MFRSTAHLVSRQSKLQQRNIQKHHIPADVMRFTEHCVIGTFSHSCYIITTLITLKKLENALLIMSRWYIYQD